MAARRSPRSRARAGAVPAGALRAPFPRIDLPVRPPLPPMEAKLVDGIPAGDGWLYEPKWDGFRCLAFRADDQVLLQSKSGQPLGRYFPEVVAALVRLPRRRFVLDGEVVVAADGRLSFDDLLQRIHPAESRVRRLAVETPATYFAFDLLAEGDERLSDRPLRERRARLERFFESVPGDGLVQLSPASALRQDAQLWMDELGAVGLDGIIAKRADLEYRGGDRTGMQKVKRIRTADCAVGGFRWDQKGREIGSLLLGLYDEAGRLDHVGFAASFTAEERRALRDVVLPLRGGPGFSGQAPGGPSRWATERSTEWEPLRPELVCEVRYDHFSGGRFRHGTKFLRWRPDKDPRACSREQVLPPDRPASLPVLRRKA